MFSLKGTANGLAPSSREAVRCQAISLGYGMWWDWRTLLVSTRIWTREAMGLGRATRIAEPHVIKKRSLQGGQEVGMPPPPHSVPWSFPPRGPTALSRQGLKLKGAYWESRKQPGWQSCPAGCMACRQSLVVFAGLGQLYLVTVVVVGLGEAS